MVKKIIAVVFGLGVILSLTSFAYWCYSQRKLHGFDLSLYSPEPYQVKDHIDIHTLINQNLFQNARVIHDQEKLANPEDIFVDQKGRILSGMRDGRLVRIDNNHQIQLLAQVSGGMVLGLTLTKDQKTLYFLTQFQGLCKMNMKSKKIDILLKDFQGDYVRTLNELTLDEDQKKIYLTQSTKIIPQSFFAKELMLKKAFGRILVYDIESKKTSILLENLYYPNGIVYDSQTDTLVMAQLNRYSISRVYTKGSKKGTKQTIIDNLPGLPDNLNFAPNGDLTFACILVRNKLFDFLDRNPFIRSIFLWFPESLIYKFLEGSSGGMRLNLKTKRIVENYFGDPKTLSFVTTVLQNEGKLYFSSFVCPTIVVIDVPSVKNDKKMKQKVVEL